ncbi:response regulator [Algoriphagus limi]|uniref:Response regulator transcription factor n=1 Tax=Algoriphagus limi TaxID=2975273 RepID=A0ABT2G503_9BACT|nr:response regulator transcription factor [Algoriphagus limi]
MIFEDNENLRDSLEVLINNSGEYQVLAGFSNVLNAKEQIENLRPDVVILDIDMPVKSGITAIPQIKEIDPKISIVIYTQFEDDDKIFDSLCAGADGYILKKTSPILLFQALKEVREGGAPLSPTIAKKVLATFHKSPNQVLRYNLTPREIEVLKLLIKGYSIKYIASELFVSYDTCKSHLKNIYTKLHVNCGKEAIAKVLEERIIL